jgi:signal peptidase II
MKRFSEKYTYMFVIAGLIIALDQWTKGLVRDNLVLGGTWLPETLAWLSPYARIVHWYNTGAAFGLFQSGSMIFMVLAFIVICAIVYYFPQVEKGDWSLRLAMSMQLAGASGNLIDRLLYDGKVTDFISVGTFPVFNVADASISVGTVVLLLGVYLQERAAQKTVNKVISEEVVNEKAGEA